MIKIGIIGGTFDPIHYGHLILAEQARDGAGLDQVIFIPAKLSPYKVNREVVSQQHRYNMVKIAIQDQKQFSISDIELNGPAISYTIHTLEACQNIYGKDTEIHFICGTDSFLGMEGWLKAEAIFEAFPLIVGSRPRYKDKLRDVLIQRLNNRYGTKIQKIHMPKIDISSTDIKKRIQTGRSIKYLVPLQVEEYIYTNQLYR